MADEEVMALSAKRAKTGGRQAGTPNKETRFELGASARVFGLRALSTIVEIMEDEEEAATTRLAAAKEVLDRGFGKAKQMVEVGGIDGDEIQHKLTIEFVGHQPVVKEIEAQLHVTKEISEAAIGDIVDVQATTVRVPQFTKPWERE